MIPSFQKFLEKQKRYALRIVPSSARKPLVFPVSFRVLLFGKSDFLAFIDLDQYTVLKYQGNGAIPDILSQFSYLLQLLVSDRGLLLSIFHTDSLISIFPKKKNSEDMAFVHSGNCVAAGSEICGAFYLTAFRIT